MQDPAPDVDVRVGDAAMRRMCSDFAQAAPDVSVHEWPGDPSVREAADKVCNK